MNEGDICFLYSDGVGEWNFTAQTRSVYRVDISAESDWAAVAPGRNATPIELNIGVYSKKYHVESAEDIEINYGTANVSHYAAMSFDDDVYFKVESYCSCEKYR